MALQSLNVQPVARKSAGCDCSLHVTVVLYLHKQPSDTVFFPTADSTEYLSLVPTPPHPTPYLQLWMRCTHSLRSFTKPHVRIFCPGLNWEGCQVSSMLEVSDADRGRGGNQRKTQVSVYACQLTLIMRWHRCSPRCRTSKWIRRLKVLSLILGSAASHSSISLSFFSPPASRGHETNVLICPPPAAALHVLTFDHLQSLQLTDNRASLCLASCFFWPTPPRGDSLTVRGRHALKANLLWISNLLFPHVWFAPADIHGSTSVSVGPNVLMAGLGWVGERGRGTPHNSAARPRGSPSVPPEPAMQMLS